MIVILERYVVYGVPTEGFLENILIHNFYYALALADDENFANIQAYANYLSNEVPGNCHGSTEKVEAWIAHERLKGTSPEET